MTDELRPPAWAEGDKATIDLKATLAQHAAWLDGDPGGARGNLRNADLRNADLRNADLRRVNLRYADLRWADLRGAKLRETNLRGADLSYAYGYVCAGRDQRGYHFFGVQHEDGWRVSAGCRWFTLAEAEAHWTKRGNEDALARVAIVCAAADASTSPPPWDFDDCPGDRA